MKQADDVQFDAWLRQVASRFDYPDTPVVEPAARQPVVRQNAPAAQRIKPAWALLTLLLVGSMLMLAPQVRASVLAVLRSGGITVFIGKPAPTAAITATKISESDGGDREMSAFLIPVVETSLASAREALGEPQNLLTRSTVTGAPADVYVDDLAEAQVAIFVWQRDEAPAYRLYAMKQTTIGYKMAEQATTTTVGDVEALWIDGPHWFNLSEGNLWQDTEGSVLIWTVGELTYRLEGAEELSEARRLAESLE